MKWRGGTYAGTCVEVIESLYRKELGGPQNRGRYICPISMLGVSAVEQRDMGKRKKDDERTMRAWWKFQGHDDQVLRM